MRISAWLAPATLALAYVPLPALAAPVTLAAPATLAAPTAFAAHALGRALPTARVPFIVHLPLRNEADLETLVTLQGTPGTQVYHHWLTPAQFRAQYGATPAQVTVVVNALRAAGIAIDSVSAQFVSAHATSAIIERTFGAQMATFRGARGKLHIGSRVALVLPAALRAVNADVEGLVYHGEPQTMMRKSASVSRPLNRYGLLGSLWFDDLKQAYKYPAYSIANGTGVRVATVNEADFDDSDLVAYLHHEKIGNQPGDIAPLPLVAHELVPGASPFDPNDPASGEADTDTQQVAGTAPGATLTGWTTNGFDFPADFLQVYDYINISNSEDIVSTSYGQCELLYTAAYNSGQDFTGTLRALHDTFLQGNSQGITYTVSSGDSAGRQCPELAYFANPESGGTFTTVPSVSMPASDPNVVALGGGNLLTSSNPDNPNDLDSAYVSENAYADPEPAGDPYGFGNTLVNQWWGAGGGQSVVWAKPSWQKRATPGTGRSLPDIGLFVGGCFSGNGGFVQPCAADVSHATLVLAGGLYDVIGTSLAAPEAAGLFATIEDYQGSRAHPGAGRLGNVNPLLYSVPASYYHKSIPGYNGVVSFKGVQTWNPSYGLGSPFNFTPFRGSAGTPQTATNP